MSNSAGFDVRQVGGRIGAEVIGVDPRDFSEVVFAEIHAALLEHKALAFRGQELTDADQLAFASRFGPLTGAHRPCRPWKAGHRCCRSTGRRASGPTTGTPT
jgi:taurine dioxygenase